MMKRLFFILAHPDDEIFAIPLWNQKVSNSKFIFFIGNDSKRQKEAEKLHLKKYLENANQVSFINRKIIDGWISKELDHELFSGLLKEILLHRPEALVTLCYEGGHQDHDAINIFVKVLALVSGLKLIEVPAYRLSKRFPGYSVMNFDYSAHKLKIKRWRLSWIALSTAFHYKSQWKSWVGLLPFILIKYSTSHFYYRIKNLDTSDLKLVSNISLYETRQVSRIETENRYLARFVSEMQFIYEF